MVLCCILDVSEVYTSHIWILNLSSTPNEVHIVRILHRNSGQFCSSKQVTCIWYTVTAYKKEKKYYCTLQRPKNVFKYSNGVFVLPIYHLLPISGRSDILHQPLSPYSLFFLLFVCFVLDKTVEFTYMHFFTLSKQTWLQRLSNIDWTNSVKMHSIVDKKLKVMSAKSLQHTCYSEKRKVDGF